MRVRIEMITALSGSTWILRCVLETWDLLPLRERWNTTSVCWCKTSRGGKPWTELRMGKLNKETESHLIAAENNTIRTNHIKARTDKTQQNSRCRLCGDRDESINHILSECSKLDTTGWERWSTGNCARNSDLSIQTNGICPTQNLSWWFYSLSHLGFWHTNGSPDLGQMNRSSNNQRKKRELVELWTKLSQLTTE